MENKYLCWYAWPFKVSYAYDTTTKYLFSRHFSMHPPSEFKSQKIPEVEHLSYSV